MTLSCHALQINSTLSTPLLIIQRTLSLKCNEDVSGRRRHRTNNFLGLIPDNLLNLPPLARVHESRVSMLRFVQSQLFSRKKPGLHTYTPMSPSCRYVPCLPSPGTQPITTDRADCVISRNKPSRSRNLLTGLVLARSVMVMPGSTV
jgi:hypothetical protein